MVGVFMAWRLRGVDDAAIMGAGGAAAIGHPPDLRRMPDTPPGRPGMPGRTRDHLTLALLLFVVLASAIDIATDLGHGAPVAHLVQEGVLMAGGVGLLGWIVVDLRRQAQRIRWLEAELAAAREQAERRSPELEQARERLGIAIEAQFRDWGMTASEQAVGWLLLKGLSIKEIAGLRATHEKTVRQQASAIYRKTGLPGRHAFVAWFIEDLL
jgi:DNA-binding CsgD family transcriptional regulator